MLSPSTRNQKSTSKADIITVVFFWDGCRVYWLSFISYFKSLIWCWKDDIWWDGGDGSGAWMRMCLCEKEGNRRCIKYPIQFVVWDRALSEHVVGNGFPTSYYTQHPSPIWPPTQQLKSMQYALFIGYVAKPYHRKRKWDLDDQGQSHTETANKITKTTDEFSSKSSAANDSSSDKSGGDPGKAALGKLESYNDKGNLFNTGI